MKGYVAVIAAAGLGALFMVGMAAMMIWMMASAGPWQGHMWGWGAGSTPPQTPVVSQTQEFTVEMRDLAFWPNDLTVPLGTKVTWVNRDALPHDATEDDRAWGTGFLNQGEQGTLTFDTAGTFSYYCTIHPQMKGTLTVS